MKKLSEAGKLYLKDFYVLNEAQNDVFMFLNAVIDQVHKNLEERVKELSDQEGLFAWEVWKNVTRPGRLWVWPSAKKELPPFRKSRDDLSILYCDVRREDKLSDTTSVSITISCTYKFLDSLKKHVSPETLVQALKVADELGTAIKVNKTRVLYREELSLDLNSVSDSVDLATESIMERCEDLKEFVLQIIKQG